MMSQDVGHCLHPPIKVIIGVFDTIFREVLFLFFIDLFYFNVPILAVAYKTIKNDFNFY